MGLAYIIYIILVVCKVEDIAVGTYNEKNISWWIL